MPHVFIKCLFCGLYKSQHIDFIKTKPQMPNPKSKLSGTSKFNKVNQSKEKRKLPNLPPTKCECIILSSDSTATNLETSPGHLGIKVPKPWAISRLFIINIHSTEKVSESRSHCSMFYSFTLAINGETANKQSTGERVPHQEHLDINTRVTFFMFFKSSPS